MIRALLNSLNGRARTKTAVARACMHGFGSNFVCKLIGPSHNFFVFLANWIRALLILFWGEGIIRDRVAVAAAAVHFAILGLDTILYLLLTSTYLDWK